MYSLLETFIKEPIDISELEALDSVYTSSRYPSDIGMISTGKPTLTESKELYDIAKKIFEIVLQTIEK